MIQSMTGYGEATHTQEGVTYHLEIRSLNNRYFKLSCKLADAASFLEAAIDSRLRRDLGRGSIYLTLVVRNMSADAAYEVNEVALASYIGHLRAIGRDGGGELPMTVDLATAILLPGVAQPRQEDEAEQEQIKARMDGLLDKALAQLQAMRRVEGEALARDLKVHLDRMSEQLDVIAERSPAVVTEYHQRLTDRVNQLLADQKIQLEADALAREVAVYADRCDINEEISRLRSHIEQFRRTLDAEDEEGAQVGRRLDFVAQEFLREANTIGSKSNDATISRASVEIKSAIDRVKEQVQNVV
ncbi:MAG: hypothetical protein BIFFINMI_00718 [Phycisphaerae bacterium]|nr:hypothetical protein [Phycisphaerae bacterium]